MTGKRKARFVTAPLTAALALAACVVIGAGSAWAAAQYENDGAMQNALGGWDLPNKGSCGPNAAIPTRPECNVTRFPLLDAAGCTAAGGSLTSASTTYCKDTVNNTVATCVDSAPSSSFPNGIDRLWNPNDGGFCILTLKGYNRNKAVCEVQQGGTWSLWGAGKCVGSWVMPDSSTYTPPLYTGTTNPGPGDQCLRCHRSDTEWNTNRVRDTEDFLLTGHKNMGRKVTPTAPGSGKPWAGPDGTIYPSDDSGNVFTWINGTVTVSSTPQQLFWIYGDWLAPLPRSFHAGSTSYTCGRCHMTGWVNRTDTTMEPELSFPGIRTGPPARTITGSWDLYGITCSRCHGSSVEDAGGTCSVANIFDPAACTAASGTWTAGLPWPAAFGRGATHHADVTNFDAVNGGYCTNLQIRNANKYTCEYFSGTWYSVCSDDRWQTEAQCIATSGCINPGNNHGLNYTSQATCEAGTAGECSIPVYTTQAGCVNGGACSLTQYNTAASCTGGGGVWTAGAWTPAASGWWTTKTAGTWTTSYCSIGTCSNPTYTTQPTCIANGGTWTNTWTDLFSCMDAGGKWTGTKQRRGQLITSLCMDCHRQETSGNPYDSTNPAGNLKVGPAHGTVAFVSHPHGNQFLNSPHGKFNGTFAQIGTGKFEYNMSGLYKSWFMTEGEAANTGNGCTGCHDVHQSVVKETGQEHAIHEECTDCHAKNLGSILHPSGTGTPLEHIGTAPAETCVSCHMPEGVHLFRINADPSYSTFPMAAVSGVVNANTTVDGNYASAVWVDVDLACGQCHGGGTNEEQAVGSMAAASAVLTLDDSTGFVVGQKVVVPGAGALEADGVTRGELETYVKSVDSATQITLVGTASVAVTDVDVEQNPTKNGAGYMTKAELAPLAEGIHNDKPVVSIGYALASPNTLQANLFASATCGGPCDAYEWDCGGGTLAGTGPNVTCTYAAAGTYTVSLTVEKYGVNSASASRNVTVYQPDLQPYFGDGVTCGGDEILVDSGNWKVSVDDDSGDDNGVALVTVTWGDGSLLATGGQGATFGPHQYRGPGTYNIAYKVVDTIGQQAKKTCPVTLSYFTISGTVTATEPGPVTNPVPSARVTVQSGATVRTAYTSGTGTYSVGRLQPGTYTVTVTKMGYSFPDGDPDPIATATVGGSKTVNVAGTKP